MAGLLGTVGGSAVFGGGQYNRAVGAGNSFVGGEHTISRGRDMDVILRLKADYRRWHGKRLKRHVEDETYYTLEYNVPTPDQNRDPLKAPTGHQVVNEMIAHMSAESPVISEVSRAKDQSSQRQASKRTVWLGGFWRKQNLTLLLRRLVWYDAVRGCHVLRVLYDPGLWPEKPIPPIEPAQPDDLANGTTQEFTDYVDALAQYQDDKEDYNADLADWKNFAEEHLPIKVQALDPQFVLWEPTEEPQSCIVAWVRTVDDIRQARPYDDDLNDYLRSFQPGTKVEWCEWWDDTKYAYWIEPSGGEAGSGTGAPYIVEKPRRHRYGFFPFLIDGPWVNPLLEAEKQYPSIYFSTKSFLQYESTLVTQMAHIFRRLGWPTLIVKTPNAHSDTQKPVLDMRPGAQNFLDETEDAHYLEMGSQTMSLLERIIAGTDEYIQDGTGLRDVMRGSPKGKSGYQQAQIAQQARVALVPVEQCLQRSLEKASSYVLKLVRLIGDKVTVMASENAKNSETAIGPDDVKNVGLIQVQLKTVLPIDEAQKNKAIHDMVEWGYFDPIEGARLSGIDNPEDKHEAADIARFEQNPQIQLAKAIAHTREHDPDTWDVMVEFGLVQQMIAQLQPPSQDSQAGDPGGPKGGPSQQGPPRPPPGPGSPHEASVTQRQSAQGGMPPKRLPAPAGK